MNTCKEYKTMNKKLKLKNNFDVREFHNQILNSGSLPLILLEQKIKNWIETQIYANRN